MKLFHNPFKKDNTMADEPFDVEAALSKVGIPAPVEIEVPVVDPVEDAPKVEASTYTDDKYTGYKLDLVMGDGALPSGYFDLLGTRAEDGVPYIIEPKTTNPKDLIGNSKPDLSLNPQAALLHMASAFMDGAQKYGPYNWRENKVAARVYIAAAQRHLGQFLDGENFDPTSNVHHLGHLMACAAILLDAFETGNLVDDRPLPGAASTMLRGWNLEGEKFQR